MWVKTTTNSLTFDILSRTPNNLISDLLLTYFIFLGFSGSRTTRSIRVYWPVSQQFPVVYFRKSDRKGHFCRDTDPTFAFLRPRAVPAGLIGIHSRVFFPATRTPKFTQSPLCSLFTVCFHSEWFTNHFNHILFTSMTQIVATSPDKS